MRRFTVRSLAWALLSVLALLGVVVIAYTFLNPPKAIDFDRLRLAETDSGAAKATRVAGASGTPGTVEPTVVFRITLDAYFGAAWSEIGDLMAFTSRQGDADFITMIRSTGDVVLQEPLVGLRSAPIFVSSSEVAAYAVPGATPQIVTIDGAAQQTSLRDLTGDCKDVAIYPMLSGQPGQLILVGTAPDRDVTADTTHVYLVDLARGHCRLWQTYPEVQTTDVVGWNDGRLALSLFRRPRTPDDPGLHDVAVFEVGGSAKPTCLIDARSQPILWSGRGTLGVRDTDHNSSVEVWDIAACLLITIVPIGDAPNVAMAHDEAHGWLYLGGHDLVVLDDQSGAVLRRVSISERAGAWVRSMTLSPDGTKLAVFVGFDQGLEGEFVVFALR